MRVFLFHGCLLNSHFVNYELRLHRKAAESSEKDMDITTERDLSQDQCEAVSIIARTKGYMDYLRRMGRVKIEAFPTKRDIFHEVEIEGVCFRGILGIDGPYVTRQSSRKRGFSKGWVQLGVAEISQADQYPQRRTTDIGAPPGKQWWVCKQDTQQARIPIDDLSILGRCAFAHEFGIPIKPPSQMNSRDHDQHPVDTLQMFYLSPSFRGLTRWAEKHPRKSRYSGFWSAYLPYWDEEMADAS